MAFNNSALPSAGSLNDLDFLADSQLDLASWLLEDDLYQQDFGKGAKNMHSFPSALADNASSPFITSLGTPDWMEDCSNINWDQPLNLEECFNTDLYQQLASSNDFSPLSTEGLFVDPKPLQQQQEQQQHELQEVFVQKNETGDIIYSQDTQSSSQELDVSASLNFPQENSTVCEEVSFQNEESPFIISVPLSEVFVEKKKPVFMTINITGIERINTAQKPVFCSTPIESGTVSLHEGEQREPRKIVINLRRVTVPGAKSSAPNVEIVPKVPSAQKDGPTLMEVLARDDANDFINEMVTMPTISPVHFESDTQEYSASQSADGFEDSGFAGGYGSPSDLLLYSPSSSSDLASVHSQDTVDSNTNCSYDDVEDNASQDGGVGPTCNSCDDSSRYAPYKSMEKKLRKKDQNKRAALRYRQKKKEEEGTVLGALLREEEKQKELSEKYNTLQMEVKLMKKLMREMLATKLAAVAI